MKKKFTIWIFSKNYLKFKDISFSNSDIELTRCALGAPRGPLWVTRSTAVKCLGGRGEWNSTLENNRIEFWSKSVMLSTLHFAYHRLPSKIQVSGTQRKLHTFFFSCKFETEASVFLWFERYRKYTLSKVSNGESCLWHVDLR